ncbi:MAG: aminoglycoside phosphotransferase family protein [Patescibacteria group bacterium]
MSEHYKFSAETESFEKITLTKEEERVITGLGIAPEDLRKLLATDPFAEGSYALIFELHDRASNLVVKAWKNRRRDSGRGANENIALRLLRARNFKHAPKLKGYLQPSTILFEEKIECETVEQFDKDHIERLALALADLHSIKLNAYGKPFTKRKEGTHMDYLLDGIETLQKISEPFVDQTEAMYLIHRSFDKMKDMANDSSDAFSSTTFTLIHFDLNKNNILYSKKDGAPVIVDWEQASAGDNAMDIAKLFLKLNFNINQKQDFLKIYESCQVNQDPHFRERLKIYEPFVLINSIIWRLEVLRDMPQQMSSDNESQFYGRVKSNLDKEIKILTKFISE